MSVVARAKVTLAIDEGKPLPDGWALDKMGRPTTDPEAALEGVLLPIGGYKGYGLALAIDVLTGAITSAGCSDEVRRSTDLTGSSMIAHQMMAIDIESFVDISSFKRKIDELIRKVKTSPTASGTEEIFIPGEIEFREEERRLSEGISIDEKSWMKIEEIAKELQLEL